MSRAPVSGALFFGQLTDRFGRKKLFIATIAVYIVATVLTAFAFSPWYFFLARFVTGAGIGGEYAAINSAIDELIPARLRGRVDLAINGTYWAGAAVGAALAIPLLDTSLLPADIGWRLAFAIGALLGLVILVVRRHVPESPRWLFIHGREEQAERIVDDIERDVEARTGDRTARTGQVHHRPAAAHHPVPHDRRDRVPGVSEEDGARAGAVRRAGVHLQRDHVQPRARWSATTTTSRRACVPVFLVCYAVGNLLGPLLLEPAVRHRGPPPDDHDLLPRLRRADRAADLGVRDRRPAASGASSAALVATFFLASAGASAAYLTVSEIFPMETRALAIAFFYAIGTGAGGIVGPLLFGQFIDTGDRGLVAIGFGDRRRGDGPRRCRRAALRHPRRADPAGGHREATHRGRGRLAGSVTERVRTVWAGRCGTIAYVTSKSAGAHRLE